MAQVLHTFTNVDGGFSATVVVGTGSLSGKFGVTVRDDDADAGIGFSTFYPSLDVAIAKAKAIAAEIAA